MAATVLGNVIEFFQVIGIYDVVLPFLLTFVIVYAILDKTMIFGKEPGTELPRKSINALVGFVSGFLVIASAQLVEVLTTISARMVVVMLLIVLFLMMAGMFFKGEGEFKTFLETKWNSLFVGVILVGVLFVFMASIKTARGTTWLDELLLWLSQFMTSTAVASVLLILFIIGVVYYVQSGGKT